MKKNIEMFRAFKLKALIIGCGLSMVGLLSQTVSAGVSSGADNNWLQDGGGPQGIRYSELGHGANEINPTNAANLKQKYVLATYTSGSAMGAPL